MNYKEIIGSVFSMAIKVVLVVLAGMFIYKYAFLAYNLGYRVFSEPPVATGEGRVVNVTIGEDTSARSVGKNLEDKGLIRDAKVFFLQELASENHGKIKPGKYDLNTNMTADEMIRIMAGADKPQTEEELLYNEDEESVPYKVEESERIEEEFGNDPDIKTDGFGPVEEGEALSPEEMTEGEALSPEEMTEGEAAE